MYYLGVAVRFVRLMMFVLFMAFMAIFGRHIPALQRFVFRSFKTVMSETYLKEDDWKDTMYTFSQIKAIMKNGSFDVFRETELYGDAPDCDVFRQDFSKTRLLGFQKKDRPLILNFGSCT